MTSLAASDHAVRRFLQRISRSGDMAMVIMLMVAMAVMILPLPTPLIDGLIAWNIGASILVLVVVVYLPQPLAFSTLPAVILTATLFRLATEVAVTRMILVQVDAGEIVRAFGDFVVSGQVIVGLVTFLIITVVQFIVITKGSERVAEVAARFTLDAMPGKQMSIDSDLRSGDIDHAEARRRRHRLEQESQLYGAMDGAMKFVKGDAIAGLVIVMVNLLGGIAIGCLQMGMSWSEATHTYSLLTIGDGLVSQIPALVISFAAGTVVTRVSSSDDRDNLGVEIVRQVAGNWRVLAIAASALTLLGAVPGFPTMVFLLLAMAAAGRAAFLWRQQQAAGRQVGAAKAGEEVPLIRDLDAIAGEGRPAPDDAMVILQLSPGLRDALGGKVLDRQLHEARLALNEELGIELPELWVRTGPGLAEGRFQIDVEGVPAAAGALALDHLLLCEKPERLASLGITAGEVDLPGHTGACWVPATDTEALRQAGLSWFSPVELLVRQVTRVQRRLAGHFMGIQEVQRLLAAAAVHHKALVEAVQAALTPQIVAETCRLLLEEGVPLRPMRLILSALAEVGLKEQQPVLLADFVRVALKRQISHLYADANRSLSALIIEPDIEEMIRGFDPRHERKPDPIVFQAQWDEVYAAIRRALAAVPANDAKPVILVSFETRRTLRALLIRQEIETPVLSYQELSQEILVQPIGSISITGGNPSGDNVRSDVSSLSATAAIDGSSPQDRPIAPSLHLVRDDAEGRATAT